MKRFNYLWDQRVSEYKKRNILLLEKNPDARFLDYGCSIGDVTLQVSEYVDTRNISCIDTVVEFLDRAEARGIKVHRVNLNERLPFII